MWKGQPVGAGGAGGVSRLYALTMAGTVTFSLSFLLLSLF